MEITLEECIMNERVDFNKQFKMDNDVSIKWDTLPTIE